LPGVDLCGRVQQALENETLQTAPSRIASNWTKAGWLKPAAGMAVAASVALMAIITVGPGQSPVSTPAGELAGSPQTESFVSPNNMLTGSPRSQQVSVLGGSGESNRKMNSYLLRHYQVTGSTGGKGFVTFVPIVVTQAVAHGDAQANPQSETEEGEDTSSLDRANKPIQ
jgi:negative regulator of sigma E activity